MGDEKREGKFRMNLRYLCVPAFLILALSICSYAQSLGEVARQYRAERQQSGHSSPKVITNADIESPASNKSVTQATNEDTADNAAKNEAGKQGGESAKDANSGEATAVKANKDAAKEREEQELALEKRSEEINRVYLDRIAAIRTQISTAQQDIAKLQLDQIESTNSFQRTLGVSPNVATYQEQQRVIGEQIQTRRELIDSLNAQLQDAQEAARHAGVPHATD